MTKTQKRDDGEGVFSGRLGSVLERLNSSFWFTPALLVLGGGVLYSVAQYLDQRLQTNLSDFPIVFSGGPTAARSVLSTIAGSLVTVVATMFSLTVVALQLASSSYSLRVLRNFTEDRGVQAVLGAYIATFLYSLMVLRIISTSEGEGTSFNPVISITVAIVLALVCVALLIYFIAHIVDLVQSSTIVRSAHRDATGSRPLRGRACKAPSRRGCPTSALSSPLTTPLLPSSLRLADEARSRCEPG